jgi:hypothetical protein
MVAATAVLYEDLLARKQSAARLRADAMAEQA